eukprot:UN32625
MGRTKYAEISENCDTTNFMVTKPIYEVESCDICGKSQESHIMIDETTATMLTESVQNIITDQGYGNSRNLVVLNNELLVHSESGYSHTCVGFHVHGGSDCDSNTMVCSGGLNEYGTVYQVGAKLSEMSHYGQHD